MPRLLPPGESSCPKPRGRGVFGSVCVSPAFSWVLRNLRFRFDRAVSLAPASSAVSSASASISLPSSCRVCGNLYGRSVVGERGADVVPSSKELAAALWFLLWVCKLPDEARDFSFEMRDCPRLSLLGVSASSHESCLICPEKSAAGSSLLNCTLLRPGGVDVPSALAIVSGENEAVFFRTDCNCGALFVAVPDPLTLLLS